MSRRELEDDRRAEELAGAALALLAELEAEDPVAAPDPRGAETIWRRFATERAPRRVEAERLDRWMNRIQWGIGAAALLIGGAGWWWLRGAGLAGGEGAAWSEVAFSPALAVVALGFAVLASVLGITFGRWLES
ncbi:MAG TPA: hypothetical protein VMV46_04560 [Thermoanaerobaculia bacterium]|nr:hypothetical protein [Thermoanaerobaculia bacterium]